MSHFDLHYTPQDGLSLHWPAAASSMMRDVRVRVCLRGSHLFSVWSSVDSGENLPRWAEDDLALTYFGTAAESPEMHCTLQTLGETGYRIEACSPRAIVTMEMCLVDGELCSTLQISNPYGQASRPLPLCTAELCFEQIKPGKKAYFLSAHPYGGQTHGFGQLADLAAPGVEFVYGCIGLALPLLYLHNPDHGGHGLQCEFMLDGRPQAWVRPGTRKGEVAFTLLWSTDRLLEVGQSHAYGGVLRFKHYQGHPLAHMRCWRDTAAERYGLVSTPAPNWVQRTNMIEFNMNPRSNSHPFTNLDDERCREQLLRWKTLGYTSIFAVSCNNVGQHWLSPFDYRPSEEVGGAEAEARFLHWARELGFHVLLWVTTVGIDRDAREVREHADWFTLRANGDFFYAWDSTPANHYLGYAPDADPLSSGWRNWLRGQVGEIIARGYDGIFIDGCIPRASNHARWNWPGESRNSVEDQVIELAAFVRSLGDELVTFVEDESTRTQAHCEITAGRYHPAPPFKKKAYWDQGMGGGPKVSMAAPERIPPEWVRDYFLVRYASLLPGAMTSDIVEGYLSEAARPWTVQALMGNLYTKTHSQYVDTPETYVPCAGIEPPPLDEQAPEHRRRGHDEFLALLRLRRNEPLLHDAPLSLQAVLVDGDAAVVGFLRPSPTRCFLTLIQFADRPACVQARLAEAIDLPACSYHAAGAVHACRWRIREVMHSMRETDATPDGIISATEAHTVELDGYSFRIFELQWVEDE